MKTGTSDSKLHPGDMWIISEGEFINLNPAQLGKEITGGPARQFLISDMARYLINPYPIEVEERLVGCEVTILPSISEKIGRWVRGVLPTKKAGENRPGERKPLQLFSSSAKKRYRFRDKALQGHFEKVAGMIRPYDSIFRELRMLDRKRIGDISGVYEDISGKCYHLNLQGSIDNKMEYLQNGMAKNVKIVMQKAYLADGLFEMKGFDANRFNRQSTHRLIEVSRDGEPRYFLLGKDGQIAFWVEDIQLVFYLHLLEQSLRTNRKMHDSFTSVAEGRARPLKLFFSRQFSYDYSGGHLPKIYREALRDCDMGIEEKMTLIKSLKNLQHTVSFHYIPEEGKGEDKYCTDISILHNFKAFEFLKDLMPKLYSEIDGKIPMSDIGKFYLLDSMKGCQNEEKL